MEIFKTIRDIKKKINDLKKQNCKIGFVPTMGNLHEGHISLVDTAKKHSDFVITSIFVNPTQFGENEDFQKYPRTFESDIEKLKNSDALFFPSVEEIYSNNFNIFVDEDKISKILCGKFRQNHFKGVLTIVNKLFNIVEPEYAFFGEKDYQQLKLIEKMCVNLNINVKIISCPIFREANGLAMSSRNNYLSVEGRDKASKIYKALKKAKYIFEGGEQELRKLKDTILEDLMDDFKVQYIEILDSDTFLSVDRVNKNSRIFICAYLEGVRLIDNISLA